MGSLVCFPCKGRKAFKFGEVPVDSTLYSGLYYYTTDTTVDTEFNLL